jgi:hypothetical protein
VSSQRSSNNASAAYEVLQEKFAILRKHSPIILRAEVGANGVFYRAAVGPFATADAASEFCDSLRAEGGICVVQKLTQDAVTPAQQLNNPPSQSSARTAPKTPEPTGAKRDTNLRVDSTEKETRNFISKKTGEWGTDYPGTSDDLARIDLKVSTLPTSTENFTISLEKSGTGANLNFDWDTTRTSAAITK